MSDLPPASTPVAPAAPAPPPAPPAPSVPAAAQAEADTCPNCGAATWGEFCFACGQPRRGLIRRFSSILGDFLDTVFSIDNRLLRTLGPLYFKPGHLTCEYIAGRRVRYVTPFRLFFFLCVFSFLSLKFYANATPGAINFGDDSEGIETAQTDAELDAALAREIAGLAAGRKGLEVGMAAADAPRATITTAEERLKARETTIRQRVEARRAWLLAVEAAEAAGLPPPPEPPRENDVQLTLFGGEPWHPESNPVAISWLPEAANRVLNERAGRAKDALGHARENPQPLVEAFFAAVPPATFVLMPLFAMLLKFMYLFKRRLYMEHLLTALHSHAFIFLSLLAISLLLIARSEVAATRPWLDTTLGWIIAAMGWWIPLYLLIAQKRIYRQNWFATVFKFGVIGIAYMVLLSFGLMLAILLGIFNL